MMNEFNLIDVDTGEIHSANISLPEKVVQYHNIKRFNMKIWVEGLSHYKNKICVSMLESRIFDYMVIGLDPHNEFREVLTQVADMHGTTQQSVSRLIKKMVDYKVLERKQRGVYLFNPFLVKAKGCTNKDISALQGEWEKVNGVTEIK